MVKDPDTMNPMYKDCYFSSSDGYDESTYVFIEGNELSERLDRVKRIHIGETGFGTGLNMLCLLNTAQTVCSQKINITYSTLEKYPLTSLRIRELLHPFVDRLEKNLEQYIGYWDTFFSRLTPGWNHCIWDFSTVTIDFKLFYGDAGEWYKESSLKDVDAWFLDGHSPEKNPEIWSSSLLHSLYNKTVKGGTLASFTASGSVKSPLREAGFLIKRKKGFGAKRHMIRGIKA